jgi:hypothetical protein
MRRLISDTFALVIFSTLGAFATEIIIVGLTLEQSLWTRLLALPVIVLTAWPYCIFRDSLFAWTAPASWWGKTILDTAAFVSFQMPIYAGLLWMNGATSAQIVTAILGAVVVISVSGRPYGLFMEGCRTLFRAHPV